VAERPPAPASDTAPPDEPDRDAFAAAPPDEPQHQRRFWRELPFLVVLALVVAIVIKTFLIQAFYIPSASMEPLLQHGDRVLVCRICLHIGGIQRGDVIVFADPTPEPSDDPGIVRGLLRWVGQGIGVARPEDDDFIKRVIGLPGDTVELRDGKTYVNGQQLDEPYLNPAIDTRPFGPVTVPDGMLFVLGDNRIVSGDSRFPEPTGVGYVPIDRVIGTAFLLVWPPSRWTWI
jgi:signal peptidase I